MSGDQTWETHPVTPGRFDDFADVINPNRRATHCWCLSHRINAAEIEELGHGSREEAMRALCSREHPPGVVTYLDGTPVGLVQHLAALADPAAGELEADPAGRRRAGVEHHLRRRARRAPPQGRDRRTCSRGRSTTPRRRGRRRSRRTRSTRTGRMDTTMAFVGTRSMFEKAGFSVVGTTDAVASRMPRLVMRRTLT